MSVFQKGMRVRFRHESGGGKVIEVLPGGQILIEDDNGMEYPVEAKSLMISEGGDWKVMGLSEPKEEKSTAETGFPSGIWKQKGSVVEVDLHLEMLLEEHQYVAPSRALKFQLDIFRKVLERAQQSRVRELIIVHGVGAGVLRDAIIDYLRDYPQLEFMDANYRKYGWGALRIFIRG